MEIFVYENSAVDIDPKALFITAFKDIWEKYKDKEHARAEFAYIWFVGSYTSDFASYLDEEQRRKEVLTSVFASNQDMLKIDDKTEIAIEKLVELQDTPALSFLRTSLRGMNKVEKFIEDTEIRAEGDGRDAKVLMDIINTAPVVIDKLLASEKKIKAEAASAARIKGDRKKGAFED